jgi:hypothetical protein
MSARRFWMAAVLLVIPPALWAESKPDVNVYDMGAAASRCRRDYGTSCATLGRDNPAWRDILKDLTPAERQKMIGAFGVNPDIMKVGRTETVSETGTLPPGTTGKDETGLGPPPRTRLPREDSGGRSPSDPTSSSDDGDADSAASEPGGGSADGASGAGGGAAAAELGAKRALSENQAQSMTQKLKNLGGKTDSLFGPEKRAEDMPETAKNRRAGQRPPDAGKNAAPPSSMTSAGAGPSRKAMTASAIPSRFSKYGAVPRPGEAPAAAPAVRPASSSLPRRSASAPGQAFSSSHAGPASLPKAGVRAAARSDAGKPAEEPGELTPEEQQELDEFLTLIDQAAATGALDSKTANSKLLAAEASLRAGSRLEDPLGAVRAILEQAQAGQRELNDREQAVVLAAASQLGFRFNRTQAYRLMSALQYGEPPPSKAKRLSWWQRLVRAARRWLSARW